MKKRTSKFTLTNQAYVGLILLTFLVVSLLSLLAKAVVPAKDAQTITKEAKIKISNEEKIREKKATEEMLQEMDWKIPAASSDGKCDLIVCNQFADRGGIAKKLEDLGYRVKGTDEYGDYRKVSFCLSINWCEK